MAEPLAGTQAAIENRGANVPIAKGTGHTGAHKRCMVMGSDELRHAAEHIRQGQLEQARILLARHIKTHPRDDAAWLLLSYAVEERSQQIDCAARALRYNPDNPRASQRMSQLSGSKPAASAARPAPGKEAHAASPPPAKPEPRSASRPHIAPSPVPETPPGAANAGQTSHRRPAPSGYARSWKPFFVLGLPVLCIAAAIGGVFGYPALREFQAAAENTRIARHVATIAKATGGAMMSLPASWTPTAAPTETPIPSPTPIGTATPTATLVGPLPSDQEEMDNIQIEVSDLRGLSIEGEVSNYIMSGVRIRPILEGMFFANGGTEAEVEDQKRQMIALGMMKPTYNLFDNILNHIADGIGGLYNNETKQIFILGFAFGGVEHYIYSHEFDHALVDQHFPFDDLGVFPLCKRGEDQCRAIQALIEGDASLLMDQWWQQYASPQDYQDIARYVPQWYTLPEQFPPPYASRDALFPYFEGQTFVAYLYDRGRWALVNEAYENPPQSSEQILHPEKYVQGETPVQVAAVPLDGVLGEGWRHLTTDTMGEWGTYLLLGYGADLQAQLDEGTALQASRGWGGDTYQVYYSDAFEATALSVEWAWDTSSDATQFYDAMLVYQDARFRGAKVNRRDGDCWEVNNQASCVFRSGRRVLWLFAPNQTVLNSMLEAFPAYP